jgi:hypothetical protein
MLGGTCGRIEISNRQNREGPHSLSAGPRAGYRRDWLIVWPLESARAHGGLTELGNADRTDTQIRALREFDFSFSTFGKTMPFFGNILPTLRSYSGIEYPPGQRLRLHFASPPSGRDPDFRLTPRQVASLLGTADRFAGPLVAAGAGDERSTQSTRSTDARRWSSSPRKWRSFRRSTCRCSRWRVVRGNMSFTRMVRSTTIRRKRF